MDPEVNRQLEILKLQAILRGNERGLFLMRPYLAMTGVTNRLGLLHFSDTFLNSLIFPHAVCEELGEVA